MKERVIEATYMLNWMTIIMRVTTDSELTSTDDGTAFANQRNAFCMCNGLCVMMIMTKC